MLWIVGLVDMVVNIEPPRHGGLTGKSYNLRIFLNNILVIILASTPAITLDKKPVFFSGGNWATIAGDWGLGTGDWGLGTGDWGLGTGDWGLGTGDWGLGTGDWGLGEKSFLCLGFIIC
ncbi:hypothetical protein JYQ62_33670 [Nostoc sp. UHCC 0702]|nr:hypothetical protein JYQ62_33670 [Nostoc sp. UHCC 0702]